MRGVHVFVFLLLGLAGPASTQNLLTNPTFDSDIMSWESVGGLPLSHTAADGLMDPRAAEVEGVAVVSGGLGIRQCVDLTGFDFELPLTVIGAAKPVDYDAFDMLVIVSFFADTACGPIPLG